MKKIFNFIRKIALSLSSMAIAVCFFVANNSTNLCSSMWYYEEEIPAVLRKKC